MVCHGESQDAAKSRTGHRRARRLATLTDLLTELDKEVSPFVSKWERQVAKEISSEAEIVANSKGFPPFEGSHDITDEISIIEDNLRLIIQRLKVCKESKHHFVRHFPKWKEIRGQNIEVLKTVGESLQTDRQNYNIYRLAGNCTSFVGGGIFVASAVLLPFTGGLSASLAFAGGITTTVGSATSIGSSIMEITQLKKKVEKAKVIIEEDKLSLEFLKNWLVSANDLSEARDSILSINFGKGIEKILQTIRKFYTSAVAMYNTAQRNKVVKALVQKLFEIVPREFPMTAVLPLIGLLLLYVSLLISNQSIFDDAEKTWETMTHRFSSAATIPLGILQPAVGAFVKTEASVVRNVAKAVLARGLIAALGMSIDAASIILTSKDIQKGSVSEVGKKIVKVAGKMEDEANILTKVYWDLRGI